MELGDFQGKLVVATFCETIVIFTDDGNLNENSRGV